jgi:hypothetical protein
MAGVHFFMTADESLALAGLFIDRFGCRFVPENNPTSRPRELVTLDEVKFHIARETNYSRFFLLSPLWSKYPLYLQEHPSKRHRYYVQLRMGGPAFDWTLSRTVESEKTKWIVPGSFSDYPWYLRDESLRETFKRPDEMKIGFLEISRYIRKGGNKSICSEKGFLGPWISPKALEEFRNGVWLRTGDFHFEPKRKTKRT